MGQMCQAQEIGGNHTIVCCGVDRVHDAVLGAIVRHFIMTFDSSILGTEVQVGSMELKPSEMVIKICDVVVENPGDAGHWKSPHILKAKEVKVDLDGETMVYSHGQEVLVQAIQIQDLEIIFEPKSLHESNVSGIMEHLQEQQEKMNELDDNLKQHFDIVRKPNKPPVVKLQRVDINGIHLKVCMHGHHGPQISLADIHYDDFEKEHGIKDTMHVAQILLNTLMKSAADNAKSAVKDFGHHAVDAAKGVEHSIESAVTGAAHSVTSKIHFPHKR